MNVEARSAKGGVLVCFAVKEEARLFQNLAAGKPDVSILVTGMGRKNAESAVREFLDNHSPRLVLTCGFAGGLNPNLKIGSVVFAGDDEVLREQLRNAGAQFAKFFCAERVAISSEEKQSLRNQTNADAVEMESDVIQSICREKNIPCATVRAISDTANENLPLDFNRLARPDMNLDYGKLAWAIAKTPWKIPALMRLQKNCRFAAEQLSEVLAKVIFR